MQNFSKTFMNSTSIGSETPNQSTVICKQSHNVVTVSGTIITTPNYPENYDNDHDCEITIRFAATQKVSIVFEDFHVEANLGRSCRYDFLAIYDGETTRSPIIEKECGKIRPGKTIQSTGNAMTLHFHTDQSESRTGFKIIANSIKNEGILPVFLKEIKLYHQVFFEFQF